MAILKCFLGYLIHTCHPGVQKFRTQNRSGQPSNEVPTPPPPKKKKKKKKKKNVVGKTNDIVIYDSRCITTFSELSKVFIHFILKKKPEWTAQFRTVLIFLISVHRLTNRKWPTYMWYILEPKSGDLEFFVGKFMSCIGRFSCCKFRTFFTEVKVAKSSDISRNMLRSITMSTYANRSENMRPFTV